MPLQLVCACGNQLRVPEAHVGRRILCPRCGAAQVAPERTAITASPSRPTRTSPPSNRLPVLLLLVAVLLVLVTAGWWFLYKGRPALVEEDLALIPADALAFVSVRLRDVWTTPMAREVLADVNRRGLVPEDVTAHLRRATGLEPEQIERISAVSVDLDRRIGWGVIKTTTPYDPEIVRAAMHRNREALYQGKTYYTGNEWEGNPVALYFVSPTVLVVSDEEGVKSCIAFSRSPSRGASGALSPILALCKQSHHLVVGFNPSPEARATLKGNRSLSALSDLRLAQLTGQVGTEAALETRVQTTGMEQAKEMHIAIQASIGMAQITLLGLTFKGGEQAKLADLGRKLLGRLKVEGQGSDIIAKLTIHAADVNAALTLLPDALGR